MIPRLDRHWVILRSVLVFLHGHLAKTNFLTIGNFKYLLLELLVAHKLLDHDHVPALEKHFLVLLNVGPAERLDECEIITVKPVFNSWHRDDYFEVPVIRQKQT